MTNLIPNDLADMLGLIRPDSGPPEAVAAVARPVATPALESTPLGILTEGELARLIGVNSSRIRQLCRDRVLTRAAPGKFDLNSITAYCAFIREKASRGVVVNDELKAEKIRKERAAAERLEIQNATARDELLPAADVRHAWGDIIRDVRAGLLAVPSRCGAALPHLSVADVESIDGEIRAALEGLADDAD